VSFRQTNNRQDTWQNYCDRHAAILAEIGLPMRIFASDRSLAEFLTAGSSQDDSATLDRLDGDRFWQLFSFATSWFDFDTIGFTAMEARRICYHKIADNPRNNRSRSNLTLATKSVDKFACKYPVKSSPSPPVKIL
jgi:hypothetical protein